MINEEKKVLVFKTSLVGRHSKEGKRKEVAWQIDCKYGTENFRHEDAGGVVQMRP